LDDAHAWQVVTPTLVRAVLDLEMGLPGQALVTVALALMRGGGNSVVGLWRLHFFTQRHAGVVLEGQV
jgi:hypothetical protein